MRDHHAADVRSVRCLVLVVSDTRTLDTDEGGKLIADALIEAGHTVVDRIILKDDSDTIRARVLDAAEDARIDAILITGGTGLGRRDVTPDAVQPLLSRDLPGFGEHLRRISFDEIGPDALLSRAFAGTVGNTAVFALPGSRRACAKAMKALVLPLLPHTVGLLA